MKIKKLSTLFVSSLGLAFSLNCFAGMAVIVSAKSSVDSDDQKTIGKIFLGKTHKFSNGSKAVPVNLPESSSVREAFSKNVVKRSPSQVKAYWAQLVFTGKGTPPEEVADDAAMKAKVAGNPELVGYIDEANVDGSVKVIYKF